MQSTGKTIVIIGIFIAVIGLVIWLFGDKLNWFGNLPGDIKVKRENFSFYMPITTMIIMSLFLSLIIWLIRKFM
ncbi:MAG: DUF2905 domain-containing protein [Bacteroidota bacterium]